MKSGYVFIDNQIFSTLLALSLEEQALGLMYQESPPPMSFIYSQPEFNRFWMHNTPAPLDIIFCYQGKISEIHRGEPFSTKIIGGTQLSDLVIELPYGTAQSLGIKVGQRAGLLK